MSAIYYRKDGVNFKRELTANTKTWFEEPEQVYTFCREELHKLLEVEGEGDFSVLAFNRI